MPFIVPIVLICWLGFFVVLFPILKFRTALANGNRPTKLLLIAFLLLFIPAGFGGYALIAHSLDIGLNLGFTPGDFSSPREFFTALNKAHAPYEFAVLSLIVLQLTLTLIMVNLTEPARSFTIAMGIASFHLALIFGVLLLNIMLGPWPGS